MNDCLAATGSTVGLNPLMATLVLLLLGAGITALVWRHRKRAASGIALLPLIVGALLLPGLSGTPAHAAPCSPPAACVPTEAVPCSPPPACTPGAAIDSIAISGARFEFGLDDVGLYPVFTLTGGGGDELMAFHEAAEEAGATYSPVLTVANEIGAVVFFFDADGYLVSAVPELPADFDGGDVYTLIYNTLKPNTAFVPAEFVMSIVYNDGCADMSADATVTGGLITYM